MSVVNGIDFYYVFTTIDVCVLHCFATICIFTYIFIEEGKCHGDHAKSSKTTRYLSNYEGEIYMIKILFICHGNICRSPMAEFIMKEQLRKLGLEEEFYVASAATSSEEIWDGVGNPVYPPARAELAKHGISCGQKRAVQLVKEDYEKYDYLIGMEQMNIRNMMRILGSDPDHKVYRLLDFTDEPGDIADPWYSGKFGLTYDQIDKGVSYLIGELQQKLWDV